MTTSPEKIFYDALVAFAEAKGWKLNLGDDLIVPVEGEPGAVREIPLMLLSMSR